MSILITGLEMPKENAICVVIFPDGEVTSQFGVPHLGTASPIPLHGRLIDLDAFLDGCKKLSEENDPEETEFHMEFLRHFFDKILPTPIVIPADKEGDGA